MFYIHLYIYYYWWPNWMQIKPFLHFSASYAREALKCLSHSINNSIQRSSALVAVMHCNGEFTYYALNTQTNVECNFEYLFNWCEFQSFFDGTQDTNSTTPLIYCHKNNRWNFLKNCYSHILCQSSRDFAWWGAKCHLI